MKIQKKTKLNVKFNEKAKGVQVVTPRFRVTFPHVYQPTQFEGKGPFNYSCGMLYDSNIDLSRLEKAISDAKVACFGKDKTKWPECKSPFKDGNDSPYDGYADKIVLSAKALRKPGVIDADKQPISEESDEFYAGCYARAQLSCKIQKVKDEFFECFYLNGIKKIEDGERLGGSFDKDSFDEFSEEDSQGQDALDDSNDNIDDDDIGL